MTSDAILNKGIMHYIFLIWVDIFHIMLAFYVRKVSIMLMYTEYLLNFSNKKILSFVKHLHNNGHLIIILYFGNFYLFNHTCFNIQECLLYNPSWPPFGTPNLLVSLNCRKNNVLMISLSECAEFHTWCKWESFTLNHHWYSFIQNEPCFFFHQQWLWTRNLQIG